MAATADAPRNVHDAFFKRVFSEPRTAAGVFRALLPEDLGEALDLGRLARSADSFVDEELRSSYSDLLFLAGLRGRRKAFVYLLLEHQSTGKRLMGWHLLKYMTKIWAEWVKAHPNAKRLPPIIPVVVHQGRRPWRGPRSFQELIDLPPALAAARPFVPAFRFVLDDLPGVPAGDLLARPMPPLARAAFVLMKAVRQGDPLRALDRLADTLRELVGEPHGPEGIAVLVRYTVSAAKVTLEAVRKSLGRLIGPSAGEIVMTTAQELIEEGKRIGEELGEQRGEQRVLLRQMERRFGPVPEAAVERVRAASAPLLDEWADRILTAASLDEVLGSP